MYLLNPFEGHCLVLGPGLFVSLPDALTKRQILVLVNLNQLQKANKYKYTNKYKGNNEQAFKRPKEPRCASWIAMDSRKDI